jgi:hypothetical protein
MKENMGMFLVHIDHRFRISRMKTLERKSFILSWRWKGKGIAAGAPRRTSAKDRNIELQIYAYLNI